MRLYMPAAAALPALSKGKSTRVTLTAKRCHETDVELGDDASDVLADHTRLVRELDVLLNGEQFAAKQASLCDIVSQVKRLVGTGQPLLERL